MKTNLKNYYAILEVPVEASVEEIRQAYHRLVQEHLDDDAMFADLKEAYEVLTSPARREDYDQAQKLADATNPPSKSVRCPLGAGAECPVLSGKTTSSDTFCPDCGRLLSELNESPPIESEAGAEPQQPQARLEEVTGKSHPLHLGVNGVGRENGDVLLPDKTVSRQHARLELGEDGSAFLEDLGSTNGTQINEKMLSPSTPTPVKNGDRLRFGSIVLRLSLPVGSEVNDSEREPSISDSETAEVPEATSPNAPAPAQVVETRDEGGKTYSLLLGTTTFGRRADNTVVLLGDPYVSGSHASITAEGGIEYVLTDVGSTNGTLLNGERLPLHTPSALTNGDVILIGSVALRFEILGMPLDEDLPEGLNEDTDSDEAEMRDTPQEG